MNRIRQLPSNSVRVPATPRPLPSNSVRVPATPRPLPSNSVRVPGVREDAVRRHFEDEAPIYDELILKLIPSYPEMIDALVSSLPFNAQREILVADLGCGTGAVTQAVLQRYPRAHVRCFDIAPNMLSVARERLAHHSTIEFIQADFRSWEEIDAYDTVVSSLALHHIETDDDKRTFYRRVHAALRDGGVFFNADNVLGANDALNAMYIDKWMAYMSARVGEAEARDLWLAKHREEDRPARLVDQIHWLEAAGFQDVEVVWKRFNFAVYGGTRKSRA
jgi:tRNA (cmo5U34)-methyltransferase